MGNKEDVERRKQLSNAALYKLKNIWIGKDKINHDIKIKVYKALVKSILSYNCGTWALAQTELNKLEAFHRKQLRKVLNIYYPTKISNKTLYKKCIEKPLSTHILECRWRLFGHILRRNEEIPANKAMQLYFHRTEKKIQGKTNYNPASDHQQRPVTNPRQPISEINRRFEISSITGTGP